MSRHRNVRKQSFTDYADEDYYDDYDDEEDYDDETARYYMRPSNSSAPRWDLGDAFAAAGAASAPAPTPAPAPVPTPAPAPARTQRTKRTPPGLSRLPTEPDATDDAPVPPESPIHLMPTFSAINVTAPAAGAAPAPLPAPAPSPTSAPVPAPAPVPCVTATPPAAPATASAPPHTPLGSGRQLPADARAASAAAAAATTALLAVEDTEKPQMNLVVVGHVDVGKSTLMGHVLFELGHVSKAALHKYEKESSLAGKASFHFAWVLDQHDEERARGVTMDVGTVHFETDRFRYTLLDAPGHRDFIPNMITGASQADVAILCVAAPKGEFDSGFGAGPLGAATAVTAAGAGAGAGVGSGMDAETHADAGLGQTREHAILLRNMGVTQLVVAVNKMDQVEWSEDRYTDITALVGEFLTSIGFKAGNLKFVPVSGLSGQNLTKPATDAAAAWYTGPTLVQQLDALTPPRRPVHKPLRITVSDVFKVQSFSGVTAAGKVESGIVGVNARVVTMPGGLPTTIRSITRGPKPVDIARAGDNVELGLSGLTTLQLRAGDVLCPPDDRVPIVRKFEAQIQTLPSMGDVPLMKGQQLVLHTQNIEEPCNVAHIRRTLDRHGNQKQRKPKLLTRDTIAVVVIKTNRPIPLELHSTHRRLGRFMLRYSGQTVAAGMVSTILA